MNDGRRVRGQDHQAVVDGSREGSVSRDGKAGDFAEGEVTCILEKEEMEAYPVSLMGNNPRNNSPECVRTIT